MHDYIQSETLLFVLFVFVQIFLEGEGHAIAFLGPCKHC